jgi:CheY-like chemotaxis protein
MTASSVEVPGRRVLIAEDEYSLAKMMVEEFAKLGVETIGPASTVKRALDLVEHSGPLDAAVLDIKLRNEMIFPVADALRARGVPFVFATGYSQKIIPERYKDVVRYEKPFDVAAVARVVAQWARRDALL